MKKTINKLSFKTSLLIATASMATILSGCPSETNQAPTSSPSTTQTQAKTCTSGKFINVAANLPLTGNLASGGQPIKDGATMALEDIGKSDPSVSCIKFDWEDNKGDPKAAVSIFQKQYLKTTSAENPAIYVSALKPQTMAIKGQVTGKGTPHFVWIFDIAINTKGETNNFRTFLNYKQETEMYLKYVDFRKPKKVAVVYVSFPHTEEQFQKFVVPRLKQMGVEVLVEAYNLETKDYKDIASKVKEFKPDLIILNGFEVNLLPIVKSFRSLSLINDGNTIGTFNMLDVSGILGKDELEGIRVVSPIFVTRPEQQKVVNWSKSFQSRFNRPANFRNAYAYDMVQVIQDASKRLTIPATPEQWVKSLKSTKLDGITGSLTFDEDGSLVTPLDIGVFRNGQAVPDAAIVSK
jgi:ABC-type branched-subunit amino acid transport system substrate-binding protein